MIAVGALGAVMSVWQLFAARHIVEKILSHQHGGHEGHHGHHGHHGGHGGRGGHGGHHQGGHHWGRHGQHGPHHPHSDVMTKTEYALIDNFRIMGFLMLSAFIAISVSGCRALKAVRKGDSKFSDLVWRKTLRRIGWVVLMCVAIHHFGKECKHLLDVHNEFRGMGHQGRPMHGRPDFENRGWGPQVEEVQIEEPQPEEEPEEQPEMMPEEPQQIQVVEVTPEEPEDEEEDDEEEEPEAGPGRHLRFRRHHHRKGGRKGKNGHNHKKQGNHNRGHSKSRKLREHQSKKELMKELVALKKQLAQNEMKLKAEKKYIQVDDQAIAKSKTLLEELIKKKADKQAIQKVKAELDMEERKEIEAKKLAEQEIAIITKEKAEAMKIWHEIQNMDGGDKKHLWKKLMALKKDIGAKKEELSGLEQKDQAEEKLIGALKAKIQYLVKNHASKKTIAELVQKLTSLVDQENTLKADISVDEADIKKESSEAEKIWEEIKAEKRHGHHGDRRHHGGHHDRRHHGHHERNHHGRPMVREGRRHHRPHHESPRQEMRSIIHEKEDLMDRERKDGWEKKFLPMNEKKMAYEKEEIEKLKKEKADPKKIEFLEHDLRERWAKEMDIKKQLEVDGKMIPAESADLEEKWEHFERDTRHRGEGRHHGGEGRHHEGSGREHWMERHPWLARHIWWARHHRAEGQHHGGHRCPGRHGHGGEGRHGGHHGHHGRRHHHCCPVPFILAFVFAAHLGVLHKYRKSLHALDAAKKAAPAVAANQVDEESVAGFVAIPVAQQPQVYVSSIN